MILLIYKILHPLENEIFMLKYIDLRPHNLWCLVSYVVYNSLQISHDGLAQNWFSEILKIDFPFQGKTLHRKILVKFTGCCQGLK